MQMSHKNTNTKIAYLYLHIYYPISNIIISHKINKNNFITNKILPKNQ